MRCDRHTSLSALTHPRSARGARSLVPGWRGTYMSRDVAVGLQVASSVDGHGDHREQMRVEMGVGWRETASGLGSVAATARGRIRPCAPLLTILTAPRARKAPSPWIDRSPFSASSPPVSWLPGFVRRAPCRAAREPPTRNEAAKQRCRPNSGRTDRPLLRLLSSHYCSGALHPSASSAGGAMSLSIGSVLSSSLHL